MTWPLVAHFTTRLISDGGDARHHLWHLWHAQQAVLGREPLSWTALLYYPFGASLLTHSLGPFMGVVVSPLWVWGPEAAYNGALFLSHWLTGYCMYLLARGLGFDRDVALFAGTVLMATPMRQAGTLGHLEKVFTGLLPLGLLALHRAFDPARRAWWTVATALVLLLTLLHSGSQFVFAALSSAFFVAAFWLSAARSQVPFLLRRSALLAGSALILVGPRLLAVATATRDPAVPVDANLDSYSYQPDLTQFFMPWPDSELFRLVGRRFAADKINWGIETPVYLTWTCLSLCLLVLLRGGTPARRWLRFTLFWVLLALGPTLKVFGQSRFTEYELPIIMPYAFLTALPGLDFMRTPGRLMLVGFVGLGIAASFGLALLVGRFPRWRRSIIGLVVILTLAEAWPKSWPHEELRPVPSFYRQIARDDEVYGVLDLPIKPSATDWYVPYSADYQTFQMTHRKGIAAGYLSRTYSSHPVFPCLYAVDPITPDILVNGEPASCFANGQVELARRGYRYVVRHKPRESGPGFRRGSPADLTAEASARAMFGRQDPLIDDDLASVYAVSPTATPRTTLSLGSNWRPAEAGRRWAASPATLSATSPREQAARLEIGPLLLHDPGSRNGLGARGVLRIRVGDGPPVAVDVASDRATSVPIILREGHQTISLALEAGNFRPRNYGGLGDFEASFAISSIDLRTSDDAALPVPDLLPS